MKAQSDVSVLHERAMALLCQLGLADEEGEEGPLPSDQPENVAFIVAAIESATSELREFAKHVADALA